MCSAYAEGDKKNTDHTIFLVLTSGLGHPAWRCIYEGLTLVPLLIVSCVPTIDEILYPVGREILYPAQPLLLQLCRVVNSAIMTPLRCCSFNCRGWNSGLVTLKSFINALVVE